ncbi:hypothetical protein U128_03805 [Anaplasma marginale str. Gypsy Plains]|nr:hypothetical protein U128_03805 [Anaplasma marginale str. Gypsy Plains]
MFMSTPDTACAVFAAAIRCARVFPICVLGLNLSPPPLRFAHIAIVGFLLYHPAWVCGAEIDLLHSFGDARKV